MPPCCVPNNATESNNDNNQTKQCSKNQPPPHRHSLSPPSQAIEKINEYLSPKPSQKTISSSSSDIKPPRHSPPSPSKSSPPRSALRSPDRDPSPYVDFPVTQAALESDEWERLKELQTDMEGEGRKRTWQGQFEIGNGLVVLQVRMWGGKECWDFKFVLDDEIFKMLDFRLTTATSTCKRKRSALKRDQ